MTSRAGMGRKKNPAFLGERSPPQAIRWVSRQFHPAKGTPHFVGCLKSGPPEASDSGPAKIHGWGRLRLRNGRARTIAGAARFPGQPLRQSPGAVAGRRFAARRDLHPSWLGGAGVTRGFTATRGMGSGETPRGHGLSHGLSREPRGFGRSRGRQHAKRR